MPVSKAHIKATNKYENKAYFKSLVRFKKEDEQRIRNAAGDSLNGFIVSAVLEKVQQIEQREKTEQNSNSECPF